MSNYQSAQVSPLYSSEYNRSTRLCINLDCFYLAFCSASYCEAPGATFRGERDTVGNMTLRLVLLMGVLAAPARADLEGNTFRSKEHGIAVNVPRGWSASALPTFPGVLLWMQQNESNATILLSSETLADVDYCQWPDACRGKTGSLMEGVVCALSNRLASLGFSVSAPTVNRGSSMITTTLEYGIGDHFLRHALSMDGNRLHSLVLVTSSSASRIGLQRTFEQVGRTLRAIPIEDAPRPLPFTKQCPRTP